MRIEKRGEFSKVSDGVIYGWAVVSSIKNAQGTFEPYVDLQGDWIPDDTVPGVAAAFMSEMRVGKDMHEGDQVADVVFCLPVTQDIAKGLGLESDRTGLVIGWKPYDKALLDKVASGERIGFSIGGLVIDSEEKRTKKNAAAEKANQHRRTFRSWKLCEISLVDQPAQEGALVGIVKRKPLAYAAKRTLYTTEVLGHQHTLCSYESGEFYVSYATAEGADCSHSHGVVFEDGKLTILADSGHSHELEEGQGGVAVVPADAVVIVAARAPQLDEKQIEMCERAAKSTPAIAPRSVTPTPEKSTMKTDAEKIADLQKRNTLVLKTLALALLMSEAHRAHAATLGDDAEGFIVKSASEREAIVKAALDADPIEVTFNGVDYRKSAGPATVELAKAAKAQAEQLAKQAADIEKASVRKQALDVLGGMPGDDETHDFIIAALRKGGDATKLEKAIATLKGMKSTSTIGKKAPGASGGEPEPGDALEAFNAGVKSYAEKNKIADEGEALVKFLGTTEGQALKRQYDATRAYGKHLA